MTTTDMNTAFPSANGSENITETARSDESGETRDLTQNTVRKPAQKPLSGTKTEKNLMTAAANEAIAQTKYELYSGAAYEEGFATVGDTLWDIAHQEREHSEIFYNYLGKIGTTKENLSTAVSAETYEAESMYPEFARIAQEEGFDEIASKFSKIGTIEANHKDILKNTLTELSDGTLYGKAPENARWFCTNCGYVAEGSNAPDRCPVCSYGKGYFIRYDVN